MASRSRPRRGGGGGRGRGPPRGGQRRPYRRGPPPKEFKEIQELGMEEIECAEKTVVIEFCSNEQGQFVKISEKEGRSRVIMNTDSGNTLLTRLNEFIKNMDTFKDAVMESEAERLATGEPFSQGNRRYFVDVRINDRGKFVKITMSNVRASNKSYVAFPLDDLEKVASAMGRLFDQHYVPVVKDNSSPRPSSPSNLPSPREVRAGGKSFYFDVDKNDRGVFVRLTELVRVSGRRTHLNIPNSCWPQMAEVFTQLGQELPYEVGSGSGSEDN